MEWPPRNKHDVDDDDDSVGDLERIWGRVTKARPPAPRTSECGEGCIVSVDCQRNHDHWTEGTVKQGRGSAVTDLLDI